MNKQTKTILSLAIIFSLCAFQVISFTHFSLAEDELLTESPIIEETPLDIPTTEATIETPVEPPEETTTTTIITEEPQDTPTTDETVLPAQEQTTITNPQPQPELNTDKADYAPGETVSIFGRFFQSLQNIVLKIFGGSVEENNYTETTASLVTNEQGSFSFQYILDNVFRPLYKIIASTISGEKLAETSFTDGSSSLTVDEVTVPSADPQTFTFTLSGGNIGSFGLKDIDTSYIKSNMTNSSTDLTQASVTGWTLTSVSCTTPGGGITFTPITNGINYTPQNNKNVTCIFTNTKTQTKTNSTVATAIHNTFHSIVTSVSYGTTVHDSATVSGSAGTPTGTVTFDWFTNGTCATPIGQTSSALSLSSGAVDATGFPQTPLSVGSYSFIAHYSGDSTYYSGDSACESLTVTKADQTITFGALADKTYGDADFSISASASSGLTVSFAASGSCSMADATTVHITGAGNCTITASQSGNSNYNAAPDVPQFFNIAKKPITVTAAAKSKTYGDADPALTYQITSGSLAAGDSFIGALSRATGENVGVYAIQQNTLALSANYILTYVGANLTINPKPITVTADAGQTKVYGHTNPVYTYTSSDPLVTFTGALSRVAGENVGLYAITQDTLSAGANYTITFVSKDFTITKKDASVTPDAKTKVYGDADPALTGTLIGFLTADSVTATYSRVAGETVLGSPYLISATLSPLGVLGNYNITYNTANFSITKKTITVIADAKTKIYGEADPALTYTFTPTLMSGDSFSGSLARNAGNNVGTYAINQGTLILNDNYTLAYSGADLTITKKSASVTPDANTKAYGDLDPTLTGSTSGFLTADSVVATYTRTSGETVLGSPYTISATLSPVEVLSNYVITYNTAEFTITARPITVTADAKSKTYGDADSSLTYQITSGSLAFSDAFTGSLTRDAGETVGSYAITQGTVALNSNYALTYVGANLTIGKKTINVTADAKSKTYGDTDPALTYIFTPALIGIDSFTGALSRATGENIGDYAITQGDIALSANYTLAYTGANFSITAKTASVTPDDASKEYSDLDPVLTGTLEGFLEADNVTAVYSRTSGEIPGGTYTISATLSPVGVLSNYDITYNTATFTIIKEKTAIAYTGDLFAFTAGPTITTAPVQLKAKLTQEDDDYPGALSLAKVTFELTPSGGGGSKITITNIPVNTLGEAATSSVLSLGEYSIKVDISEGNGYWKASELGYGTLVVVAPTLDQRVTGGGWIADSQSANGKDNFGFTVNYNKNGAPKGNFLFMFRETDGYNYQVKSNSWAKGGLSFTNDYDAFFTAKATIQKIDRVTGIAESLGGDFKFVVNIHDSDAKLPQKGTDTIAVTIYNSNNTIWRQIGTTNLGGGNIVVHSK